MEAAMQLLPQPSKIEIAYSEIYREEKKKLEENKLLTNGTLKYDEQQIFSKLFHKFADEIPKEMPLIFAKTRLIPKLIEDAIATSAKNKINELLSKDKKNSKNGH